MNDIASAFCQFLQVSTKKFKNHNRLLIKNIVNR